MTAYCPRSEGPRQRDSTDFRSHEQAGCDPHSFVHHACNFGQHPQKELPTASGVARPISWRH
eukprot:4098459-Amphidinium_carterae.1